MRQALETITQSTKGQGFYELTGAIANWIGRHAFSTGLLTVFCRHTSASLVVTENASSAVRLDAMQFLARLAPEGDGYQHDEEGPDDMPAHLRALLTQTSLSVPIGDGRLLLGRWQGIYLVEHRRRPHRREIVLHGFGD